MKFFLILTVMFANISTRRKNFYLDPSLHSGGRLGKTGRQVKIDKKDMTDRDVAEMFHALRKLRKCIPTLSGKTLANCHLLPQKM